MRRNVLLITADQWRGDCLSALGHPAVRTPNLDALAADGVLFRNHFANAVPCAPSRACLHTGRYLHNHRAGTNGTPLDLRFANWALEARTRGYAPALFGYTHTGTDPRYVEADDPALRTDEGILPGIDPVVAMGTDCTPWVRWLQARGYRDLPLPVERAYAHRAPAEGPDVPAAMAIDAAHSDSRFLLERFLDWSRDAAAAPAGPGWFAHLSLRAPHPPWVAYAPWHRACPLETLPPPRRAADPQAQAGLHPWLAWHLQDARNVAHADPLRHRRLQAGYYGLMAEVDHLVGELVAELRRRGELERTLLVFTSDHGEQMGDHWLYGKAGFTDASFHVPLIIRDPDAGAIRGRVVDAFTEHVDLLPTLLEWIGANCPVAVDGAALQPWLAGATPPGWRSAAHFEYDFRDPVSQAAERHFGLPMAACNLVVRRERRWKYVHFAALPPLLFDLEADPAERVDRAADPGCAAERLRLAGEVLSWRMRSGEQALDHLRITPETGLVAAG